MYIVVIQACQCSLLNFIPGSGNVPKVSKHTLDEPPLHSQLASICLPNVPTTLCLDDPPPSPPPPPPCSWFQVVFVLNLSHTPRSYDAFGFKAKLDQSLVKLLNFVTASNQQTKGLRITAFSIH